MLHLQQQTRRSCFAKSFVPKYRCLCLEVFTYSKVNFDLVSHLLYLDAQQRFTTTPRRHVKASSDITTMLLLWQQQCPPQSSIQLQDTTQYMCRTLTLFIEWHSLPWLHFINFITEGFLCYIMLYNQYENTWPIKYCWMFIFGIIWIRP